MTAFKLGVHTGISAGIAKCELTWLPMEPGPSFLQHCRMCYSARIDCLGMMLTCPPLFGCRRKRSGSFSRWDKNNKLKMKNRSWSEKFISTLNNGSWAVALTLTETRKIKIKNNKNSACQKDAWVLIYLLHRKRTVRKIKNFDNKTEKLLTKALKFDILSELRPTRRRGRQEHW